VNVAFSLVALIGGPGILPALRGNRKVRIDLGWFRPSGIRLAAATLPLVLVATVIEGLGTGVASPATLNAALTGLVASDRGAAGAGTSAQASSAHPSAQPF
jgi:hypothetical protein